jgi:hypothetical protein
MAYGDRTLRRDMKGGEVQELQMRLAGFRGTVPDGDFGAGTELQVVEFQHRFMGMPSPTGVADRATLEAIQRFGDQFPIDFAALECPCNVCPGFGRGRLKGAHRDGKQAEAFHLYEYPGVHRMLLWAIRAAMFQMPEHRFVINSGYRCEDHNRQKGRSSTNHRGKAVDLDVGGTAGEDRRDDMERCNRIRGVLVELANAQIGWSARNRKALEPPDIAPTWVHYDVRCYDPKYLEDRFFCRTHEELDHPKIV